MLKNDWSNAALMSIFVASKYIKFKFIVSTLSQKLVIGVLMKKLRDITSTIWGYKPFSIIEA
ncbi:hypothetical protein CRD36_06910 [Paremcibacter congregatus]|uniref:Uncharacterized protein n=1 Tax=Paremcibacter congregatus TaxID=2043170 RepID=A0A2G4YS44_9PROT|nr:hypothetical protein CRD36_06910 [Paremcibacter congregatus]